MNNTFEFVSNSLLNHSKSKEAHLFSKAPKLPPTKPSPCTQSAYDLTKISMSGSLISKQRVCPQDSRFKSSATISPAPVAYIHRSFTDINRSTERGKSFGHEAKIVNRSKTYLFPGPGQYQSKYNPEKKLSYTMRSKANMPDYRPKVGPGQYQVQNYDGFNKPVQVSSKYSNTKNTVIGSAKRFNPKASITPGPGPFAHSRVKTEVDLPNYSFGRVRKEWSYIRKNNNPAPDYYNKFSEFSELKGGYGLTHSRSVLYQ